jgi:hypothetical protein
LASAEGGMECRGKRLFGVELMREQWHLGESGKVRQAVRGD